MVIDILQMFMNSIKNYFNFKDNCKKTDQIFTDTSFYSTLTYLKCYNMTL